MDLKYRKQNNCPSDEILLAYKTNCLAGDQYEATVLHLLFCHACLEALQQLPWTDPKELETSEVTKDTTAHRLTLSPELVKAIESFREFESQQRENPPKSLDEVKQKGGLKVGQIWRTQYDHIRVPLVDGEESFSVTDLNSTPHLVVITSIDGGTPFGSEDFHVIHVAPTSAETDYASDGDLVISKEASPLGYSFMIELWNEQPMLLENLESCIGEFDEVHHNSTLAALKREGQQIKSAKSAFSLEDIVMSGRYSDPIMRYRAHEYEDTQYLRMPAESLLDWTDEDNDDDYKSIYINLDDFEIIPSSGAELNSMALTFAAAETSTEPIERVSEMTLVRSFSTGEVDGDVLVNSDTGEVFLRLSKAGYNKFWLGGKTYSLEPVSDDAGLFVIQGLPFRDLKRSDSKLIRLDKGDKHGTVD